MGLKLPSSSKTKKAENNSEFKFSDKTARLTTQTIEGSWFKSQFIDKQVGTQTTKNTIMNGVSGDAKYPNDLVKFSYWTVTMDYNIALMVVSLFLYCKKIGGELLQLARAVAASKYNGKNIAEILFEGNGKMLEGYIKNNLSPLIRAILKDEDPKQVEKFIKNFSQRGKRLTPWKTNKEKIKELLELVFQVGIEVKSADEIMDIYSEEGIVRPAQPPTKPPAQPPTKPPAQPPINPPVQPEPKHEPPKTLVPSPEPQNPQKQEPEIPKSNPEPTPEPKHEPPKTPDSSPELTVEEPNPQNIKNYQRLNDWITFLKGEKIEKSLGKESTFKQSSDILTESDDNLEQWHDYIQIFFPNKLATKATNANQDLYLDNPDFKKVWELRKKEDSQIMQKIQSTMKKSFKRMLEFWGFEADKNLSKIELDRAEDATERRETKLSKSNHNRQRVTRVLLSLRQFGLQYLATMFYEALTAYIEDLTKNGKGNNVDTTTINYWSKALTDPLATL